MMAQMLNMLKWSGAAAVLVTAVVLSRPLLDRRFSPRWRYCLWLVLAAALLLSPLGLENAIPALPEPAVTVEVPEVALPVRRPAQADNVNLDKDIQIGTALPQGQGSTGTVTPPANTTAPSGTTTAPSGTTASPSGDGASAQRPQTAPAGTNATEKSSRAVRLSDILAAVWLAGAVIFAALHIRGTVKLARRARRWRVSVPASMLGLYHGLCAEMGIKNPPGLGVSRGIDSPMVMGLTHRRLWMPDTPMDDRDAELILRHELTHVLRRDLWYKALVLAAGCLHWFNPAVWIMRRDAFETVELLCDGDAMSGADRDTRQDYCEMLLSNIRRERGPVGAALTTSFYGGAESVKKRFRNLLGANGRRFGWAVLIAALLAIGVAACAVSVRAMEERPESWSLDLATNRSLDMITEGFAVDVSFRDGDRQIDHRGDCEIAGGLEVSDSGVRFTVTGGTVAEESVLEAREFAVYDSARDGDAGSGRDDTDELRQELERVFLVSLDGVTVPGQLRVTESEDGTVLEYLFDEPLELPESGELLIAVGREDWVSLMRQVRPGGGEDSDAIDEGTLDLWQERLNSPEWNGFVSHYYRSPDEMDLSQLLYLGGGIARELTDEERQAVAGLDDVPRSAFDRDTVEQWLLERTGVGLDVVRRGRYSFGLIGDAMILGHGDTNFNQVTVLGGTERGGTTVFHVTDDQGRMSDLTLDGGRIVSFTNPLHSAMAQAQEEYLALVGESFRNNTGLTAWSEPEPVAELPQEGTQIGDFKYYLCAWEYRLFPDGDFDGDTLEMHEPEVTLYSVDGYLAEGGQVYTVLREDSQGSIRAVKTLSAQEARWMDRDDIIDSAAGVQPERSEAAELVARVVRALFPGEDDYSIAATVTRGGRDQVMLIDPRIGWLSAAGWLPDRMEDLTWTQVDQAPDWDAGDTVIKLQARDLPCSITVARGSDMAVLRAEGDTAYCRVTGGDIAEYVYSVVEDAAECYVMLDVHTDENGGPEAVARTLAEMLAENYRSMPDYIDWRPADLQVASVSVFDVYYGQPGQICASFGFYVKLTDEDIDSPARMMWETGSGLGDRVEEGRFAGYYPWGMEATILQRDDGVWELRGLGTGGASVEFPGWTFSYGGADYIGSAPVETLVRFMTETGGDSHDWRLPMLILEKPMEELRGLRDALASLTPEQARDVEDTMRAYLRDQEPDRLTISTEAELDKLLTEG